MSQKCVWVREIRVLPGSGRVLPRAKWEIWEAYTTKREAIDDSIRDFIKRPTWVTARFHKATNRIRKYVPERGA